MRLGKQIFDKRESLPDTDSRSLNGSGANNTPCPAQAASSAAACSANSTKSATMIATI